MEEDEGRADERHGRDGESEGGGDGGGGYGGWEGRGVGVL